MASYLILTPPGGPDKSHEKTRFIRDGFSLPAFLLPMPWLLYHRLWLPAITALLLQGIGSRLLFMPGFWPAGATILFGTSLLAAIEGRNIHARDLAGRGWTEEGLVSAHNLAEAEEIYFSNIGAQSDEDIPMQPWDIPGPGSRPAYHGDAAIGFFGYEGGR